MIAEINNKLSSSGSNLSDRMEDKLTGDFFGSLRYLAFEKGLKIFLKNLHFYKQGPSNGSESINELKDSSKGFIGNKIQFWPKNKEAELDLSIEFENVYIGVEVKYNSPLSSKNQLERELEVINRVKKRKEGLLIFVSKGTGLNEALKSINMIEKEKPDLIRDVPFSYITWEEIYELYEQYEKHEILEKYERLILGDIVGLLESKGFKQFKNFELGNDEFDYLIDSNEYFTFNFEIDMSFDYRITVKEEFYEFK